MYIDLSESVRFNGQGPWQFFTVLSLSLLCRCQGQNRCYIYKALEKFKNVKLFRQKIKGFIYIFVFLSECEIFGYVRIYYRKSDDKGNSRLFYLIVV